MISLTFPDGSKRDFKPGVTGREVAEQIAKSLAKKAVAVALDGSLRDLAEPIKADATIRILTRDDPGRSRSSATTPPMSWPRRCRSSIPARKSPSAP